MQLLPNDREMGWTPFAWLIYIVPFTLGPGLDRRGTAAEWILTLIGLAIFLVLYFRGHWARGRELLIIAAAITILGIAYWPWNYGAGAFFIYAASFAAVHENTTTAKIGIGAITIVVIAVALFHRVPWFHASWPIVFTMLVGAINYHYAQVGRTNAKLRLAHDEIEHLAKVAERERIARDLHDLLGHTLSLIILKSELASKLDPERAREEIRDVERISRDALAQVRVAVRGYRSGGLQAEIDAAREALQSAGVALEVEINRKQLPPAHEAVIALAIREAITNIVRHAQAKRCTIRLIDNMLTISDDGRGGNAPFGSGLAGMQERVETLGGTMTRDGSRGTTLTITLPSNVKSMQESA